MTHIAIAYHSGYGHTKVLAESVAAGIEAEGAKATLIAVDQGDDYWNTLEAADGIVFGTPTYMGSVSGPFKMFMDASSKVWFQQKWKNKIAAAFTNSGSMSGDKLNTLQTLMIFGMQHQMVWVGLDVMPGNNSSTGSIDDLNRLGSYSGVMAQSNSDQGPDLAPPAADRKTAEALGRRVAIATKRWNK